MQTEMSGPRLSVLLGLVLLLVSVGPCRGSIESEEITESQTLLSIILDIIKELKNCTLEESKSFLFFNNPHITLGKSEVTAYRDHLKQERADSHYETEPTPLHLMTSLTQSEADREYMKMNFILEITGPLYFRRECIPVFNRLYHKSKDCNDPDRYRRCARLLIRLANNPKCKMPMEESGTEATPSQIP